jgi:hypothetical protein
MAIVKSYQHFTDKDPIDTDLRPQEPKHTLRISEWFLTFAHLRGEISNKLDKLIHIESSGFGFSLLAADQLHISLWRKVIPVNLDTYTFELIWNPSDLEKTRLQNQSFITNGRSNTYPQIQGFETQAWIRYKNSDRGIRSKADYIDDTCEKEIEF